MLCIAVAPESRRLGKVDLFNAAGQCDLIELRLDRLGKEPDLKEMFDGISKPVLISCRRQADGGAWTDSEDDRLVQLRTAIIANPAYVELELDIAGKIPRFGSVKRVISHTSLDKPLTNVEALIDQAKQVHADVVKFVAPTPTLDAAWPLLAAVAKKRDLPVVGMGLGREGVMFSLLGQKYGAPWVYAALEKGLEAFAGQPTVTEMEEVFHYREINPQTRFVAVAGFGPAESTTVRAFNTAFAAQGLNVRCLPLEIGISGKAQQMLDNLNINLVVCNPALAERSLNLAEKMDESARKAQYADLLVKQADGWQAFNTGWKSVLRVLEAGLGARAPEDRPLDRRNVLIIGTGGLAKSVAYGVQRRQGLLSVAGADDAEAKQFAQLNNARYIPVANLYDTLCDVVVLAEVQRFDSMTGLSSGTGLKLNPAFLRSNMHVIDLTQLVGESPLTREARLRGAKVISGEAVFADMVSQTYKAISGKELDPTVIHQALAAERPMDVTAE